MKKYIYQGIFKNIGFMTLGVALFFSSFTVGESTVIGGIMHLLGCAFVCGSTHNIHDLFKHK